MDVIFRVGSDRLEVEGRGLDNSAPCHPSELSEIVLRALVDEHEIVCDGQGARFRFVKRRRHPVAAGS